MVATKGFIDNAIDSINTVLEELVKIKRGQNYQVEQLGKKLIEEGEKLNEQAEKSEFLISQAEPVVTIEWSESPKLKDGRTMGLLEADRLFNNLDSVAKDTRGYDKTKFRIDFMMHGEGLRYEGHQDLGDGDGGLLDHIEKTASIHDEDANQVISTLMPYLWMHCELSQKEQDANNILNTLKYQDWDAMDEVDQQQIQYFGAVTDYVVKCRALLNQGPIMKELPEAPKPQDYIPSKYPHSMESKSPLTMEDESIGEAEDIRGEENKNNMTENGYLHESNESAFQKEIKVGRDQKGEYFTDENTYSTDPEDDDINAQVDTRWVDDEVEDEWDEEI